MTLSITVIIIIITCLVSIAAFGNERIKNDLIFYPPSVTQQRQWYRFITSGFIHADVMHLLFNMYAFYGFGQSVEYAFTDEALFGSMGKIYYLLLYLSALVVCLLPTYSKNKDNSYYMSLGASGAVSAVIFAHIMLDPIAGMELLLIPVPIPGFIFGTLFLFISSLLDKRGGSNINHSAHLWGAIYGIGFVIVFCYVLTSYPVLGAFIRQIQRFLGMG